MASVYKDKGNCGAVGVGGRAMGGHGPGVLYLGCTIILILK